MREYPYSYTLCPDNSPSAFREACEKIESIMPHLARQPLLTDVDGSTIQSYERADGRRIVVYDDYDVGAVYVLSDFDLKHAIGTNAQ